MFEEDILGFEEILSFFKFVFELETLVRMFFGVYELVFGYLV